jgi:hypothetical protein
MQGSEGKERNAQGIQQPVEGSLDTLKGKERGLLVDAETALPRQALMVNREGERYEEGMLTLPADERPA